MQLSFTTFILIVRKETAKYEIIGEFPLDNVFAASFSDKFCVNLFPVGVNFFLGSFRGVGSRISKIFKIAISSFMNAPLSLCLINYFNRLKL